MLSRRSTQKLGSAIRKHLSRGVIRTYLVTGKTKQVLDQAERDFDHAIDVLMVRLLSSHSLSSTIHHPLLQSDALAK